MTDRAVRSRAIAIQFLKIVFGVSGWIVPCGVEAHRLATLGTLPDSLKFPLASDERQSKSFDSDIWDISSFNSPDI